VLIDTVGLSPTQFGFSMLFQSGTFLAGSLAFRLLMRWLTPRQAILPGLGFMLAGSIGLATAPHLFGASLLTIMLPVAFHAFGAALMMPYMMLAGMRPFPKIAGQAAAMTGFMQIGSGLVGGMAGAWIGAPVLSVTTVIPVMAIISISAYFVYRRAAAKAELEEADLAEGTAPVVPAPAE
jgi:MFS family permease